MQGIFGGNVTAGPEDVGQDEQKPGEGMASFFFNPRLRPHLLQEGIALLPLLFVQN